jgi:superfamily II DNA or RNA helicase
MLIDNKFDYASTDEASSAPKTVKDFILKHACAADGHRGKLDVVTGYFTIGGLSLLAKELDPENKYRLVLSELVSRDDFMTRVIDLLQGDAGIESALNLSESAKCAVEFLKRETVQVRAITNAFCHAKAYVYEDAKESPYCFYVMGSSNLTEAGLGCHASSNVELNFAQTGKTSAEYGQLRAWFEKQWQTVAQSKIVLDPKAKPAKEMDVKEYFISRIEECFCQTRTPEEIYYKILFERFHVEMDLEDDAFDKKEMALLQDSTIYRTLFDYQKKGVVSLIKMLKKWDGAILADAVGLGKTFSALAVMKYFQNNGYEVLMLCPKKLEQNWKQYRRKMGSRFDRDEFDYAVRFHTDLQDDRMEKEGEVKLSWLKKQQKLLVVVDESHNLRNDKSSRYQKLLNELLAKDASAAVRDVKVLLLSATPINNSLTDIRNQFNLIAKGDSAAFDTPDFQIPSLDFLFQSANKRFNEWCEKPGRTIADFIAKLPPNFFNLTDKLIVARTRQMIEKTLGEDLGFPKKDPPLNLYVGLDGIGDYPNVAAIYDALLKTNLTAYQPTKYMLPLQAKSGKDKDWQDNTFREEFLVKMMAVLFIKRLESCWYSCLTTIEKVLATHEKTLAKVNAFLAKTGAAEIGVEVMDVADAADLDDDGDFTLRDATIHLADMVRIHDFKKDLEADVLALQSFYANLKAFEEKFKAGEAEDAKLAALVDLLAEKRKQPNRKAIVFTTFGDTAEYLYAQIRKEHPDWRIACITGQKVLTGEDDDAKKSVSKFQRVLQRFAPRAKLFHERDWSDLYQAAGMKETHYDAAARKWNVDYETWRKVVAAHAPDAQKILDSEIDVLVATDCLSEGQNLQDADCVVNYDIHWNPVRLIQRFGRIDRIGSANKVVRAVNFWPTKNYDEFLHLTGRLNNRMVLMRFANTEIQPTDAQLEQMVKDDPLVDHNTQKLLDQMANADISEIEDGKSAADGETLGLQDFSLETFRQDLQDFFEKHRDLFLKMPSGVFSGFRLAPGACAEIPESLVAVLGYPRRKPDDFRRPYQKVYILLQPAGDAPAEWKEMSEGGILSFLRKNRKAATDLPAWILKNDAKRLGKLSDLLKKCIAAKKPGDTKKAILNLMNGNMKKGAVQNLDEVFKPENFDLIAWEYVSREGAAEEISK